MIVVDANNFLRVIVQPQTPQDIQQATTARTLFRLAATGQETFITNEAIVAEVVFILSAKGHYNLPRPDVVARLKPFLTLPSCKLPDKTRVLKALDLWEGRPSISFVDALTATMALDLGVDLGTFDRRLARVPGVTVWQPPAAGATGPTNDKR
jgi:predicted nucleic acid-binding protein